MNGVLPPLFHIPLWRARELNMLMHKIFSICVVATVTYKNHPFYRVHSKIWTPYLPLVILFPVGMSASGSPILGAFAQLRKAAVSFIMSVIVRPPGTTWLSLNAFPCNWTFEYFSKDLSRKCHIKIWKNNGYFTWLPTYINDNISLISLYNDFDTVVEKIKIHFIFNNVFMKILPFM